MDPTTAAMASATALARACGAKIAVAVYDGNGRCLGSTRMQGAPWLVEEEARAVALACASLGMGSVKIAQMRGAPWLEGILARRSDFGVGGGGAVVKRDGRVHAAVGVSGASDDVDAQCAERAAACIGDTDADLAALSDAAFLAAMGAMPVGVTVIATVDPETGAPRGTTSNGVVSISRTPPVAGIVVGHSAQSDRAFAQCEGFAVSVLHAEQRQLAVDLARTAAETLDGAPLKLSEGGYPVIENSRAAFECRTQGAVDIGDHLLVWGRMVWTDGVAEDQSGLVSSGAGRFGVPADAVSSTAA